MEVNDRGMVSGKPLAKNFFLNGSNTGLDIINPATGEKMSSEKLTPEKKQEIWQANIEKEFDLKTDEQYQAEIDEIVEYNEKLKELTDIAVANGFKLNGNSILLRLYKHPPVRKEGSFYTTNKLMVPFTTEGGKKEFRDSPLQFIHRGVVHNISNQCSETFRNNFKVGDIIDLKMGLNLLQQVCYLHPEDYYQMKYDNWFIVNENMIEKGII